MAKQTRYGSVDEAAFEAFQEELRELHRMAEELISADLAESQPTVPDHESIWMLAEDISMGAWEWPEIIEAATDIADEIAKLAPDPDAEWEDDDE